MTSTFQPSWVSPPGDSLVDALEEQGLTQAQLAARAGFSRKHVNDLVRGRATITADTAMRLEAVVGAPAKFWLSREAQYREALARRARLDELRGEADWLKELPVADMVRFGWVKRRSHRGEQVAECLRFFGVASVGSWREIWSEPLAAFRASNKAQKKAGAVAAWLRAGEREAAAQRCEDYDRGHFLEALAALRALTQESDPKVFVPEVRAACARVGVSVVFTPRPKGCPVSGATRWLSPTKAMLMLSLRYKTNDHLWFSFFHECGHLLKHGKRMLFLEGTDSIKPVHEDEADRFARDLLIRPADARRLSGLGYDRAAVVEFARRVGIVPGIVVGRMQKEGLLPWSHLNDLKVRYEWTNGDDD